jgi:hypothetical protein
LQGALRRICHQAWIGIASLPAANPTRSPARAFDAAPIAPGRASINGVLPRSDGEAIDVNLHIDPAKQPNGAVIDPVQSAARLTLRQFRPANGPQRTRVMARGFPFAPQVQQQSAHL